jgi:hypothetical protein
MNKTKVSSISAIAAVAVFVAACSNGTPSDAQRVELTYDLKDPDSAKFRNEHRGTGDALCGEMNAKNPASSYIGFKRYILVDSKVRYLEDADPPTIQSPENLVALLNAVNAVKAEHKNQVLSGPELERLATKRFFEDKWNALCGRAES